MHEEHSWENPPTHCQKMGIPLRKTNIHISNNYAEKGEISLLKMSKNIILRASRIVFLCAFKVK